MKKVSKLEVVAPKPAPVQAPASAPATVLVPLTAMEIQLLGVCMREYKEAVLPIINRNTQIKDTDSIYLDLSMLNQKMKYYITQLQSPEQESGS